MTTALVNARVLTPGGFAADLAVLLEGGRILDLVPASDPRVQAAERRDLTGRTVLPGFIDCQVNGGGGALFNDTPSVEGILAIARAHRRYGTTGLLPTLISDSAEVMHQALAAVDAAVGTVPGVLGIHVEGPYLAPTRKGVHAEASLRQPAAAETELLAGAKRQWKLLVTLAPERVSPEFIRALTQAGVIVAIGHTDADYASVHHALEDGARGFTHLFNAMSALKSREPGAVGAALEDPGSWCGVIVDGHHVHPASLKVALAAKPRGKVFLVTDAMPPVGAVSDSFMLNGEPIRMQDGIVRTADGVLAGSALSMIEAVRNSIRLLGLPLEEAARMASTYPADFLGLAASHGRIVPGCRADLTVVDDTLNVTETWIGGERETA